MQQETTSETFARISAQQLCQSTTQPDVYYHHTRPICGVNPVGVILADGTQGYLVDEFGSLVRFAAVATARRFCANRNRSERQRVRRSVKEVA